MPTDSITFWDEFVIIFLKKYYLMHKVTKIKIPSINSARTERTFLEISEMVQ